VTAPLVEVLMSTYNGESYVAQQVQSILGQSHENLRLVVRDDGSTDSTYDALRQLAAHGLAVPDAVLDRDVRQPYAPSPEVEAAWAEIYRDPEAHWDLYELAEKLVDLEYHFQRWRFGHLKTVERIIGFKKGTGGTPGVPYLAGVLKQAFFPELLSVRTAL